MEAKKLYNELIEAVNYTKNEVINESSISTIKLLKIIEYLEIESRKEAAKSAGDSKPLKYASALLKKSNKSRPILQKAIIRDGLQSFTDSYILFTLKNHITGLDMHDEIDYERYPKFDRLIPETSLYFKKPLNELIEEIATLKDDDIYLLPNEFDYKIGLYVKHLKAMYNILRFKKDGIIEFGLIQTDNKNYVRPLIVKNNDDTCLLLPVRTD
jgi:hypothetical protein